MAVQRKRGVPDSASPQGSGGGGDRSVGDVSLGSSPVPFAAPLLHLVSVPLWLLESTSSSSVALEAPTSLGVPCNYDASACTAAYVPLGAALQRPEGTIIARTLAPSTLELRSLPKPNEASAPAPIQLKFPAPLLPDPALRMDDEGNLHILAATSAALHRVTLPASAMGALGMGDMAPQPLMELQEDWCFEVTLEGALRICVVDEAKILVQSSKELAVVEQHRDVASGEFINHWRTQPLRMHGFLRAVSRLFGRPAPTSPSAQASQPTSTLDESTSVALCSYFCADTLPALAFSVSVDAKLRIWDVLTGSCARVQDLPASASRHAAEHQPLESLPPFGSNTLVRAYPATSGRNVRVLVFVPAAPRRFFVLYDVQVASDAQGAAVVGEVTGVWAREEADGTRRLQLVDAKLEGEGATARLWAVWEAEGPQLALLDVDERLATLEEAHARDGEAGAVEMDESRGWVNVHATPAHPPLHGAAFEAALTSAPDVPGFFLQRLLHAGRFTPYFAEALDAHLSALDASLPAHAPRPPTLRAGVRFETIAHEIAASVGTNVQLTLDPQTGAWQTDAYAAAVRREWTAFARSLEEREKSANAPLLLLPDRTDIDSPMLLLSGGVASACAPDQASLLARYALLELAARSARGRGVPRAIARLEMFKAQMIGAERIGDDGEMDETSLQNILRVVAAATRFEASLPAGTGEALAHASRKALRLAAQMSVGAIAWDVGQSLELSETDLELVRAACAELGEDLAPTLWSLGDVLVSGGPSRDQDACEPTRLSVALVADAALRAVEARKSIARSVALLLLALTASEELPDGMDQNDLEALTTRAICTLNDIEALASLAALSAEREVSTNASAAGAGAVGEDESLIIVRFFDKLNVDRNDARIAPEFADGPAANLLHLLFLRGVLGVNVHLPSASITAAHALAESGLLGPRPPSARAQIGMDDAREDQAEFRAEPYLTREHACLADTLVKLGHASAALNLLEHYPACTTTSYLRARALVQLASFDEASLEFDAVVPFLTSQEQLEEDDGADGTGLMALLPLHTREAETDAEVVAWYEAYVSDVFASAGAALQSALHAEQTLLQHVDVPAVAELYTRIFNAHVAAADFTAAHDVVLRAPNEALKLECLRGLIGTMCDAGEAAKLLGLAFPGLQADVERTLAFKARNSDPIAERNFYRILYAFHMQRGDLKGAGAVMYQHAHSLEGAQRRLGTTSDDFAELAVQQARSYLAAINALSLIDPRDAWFANSVPVSHDERYATRRSGGKAAINAYIPASQFHYGVDEIKIVRLEDLRREYRLVLAHLELLQIYPEFMRAGSRIDAQNAVLLYSRNGQFDKAIAAARALEVDQTGIFDSLAIKCVGLARSYAARRSASGNAEELHPLLKALRDDEDADADAGEAAFLLASERSAHWQGPASERAWKYLQLHLEAEDNATVQWRYRVATLDRIVQLGAIDLAPKWLMSWFKENKPDLLVSTCLRYGLIDEALKHAIAMVERTTTLQASGRASSTWLPYSILDALLVQAEDPSRPTHGSPSVVRTRELAHALRTALSKRVETLGKRQSEMKRFQAGQDRAARERTARDQEKDGMEWRPES